MGGVSTNQPLLLCLDLFDPSRVLTSPQESIWMLGITLWEICSFAEMPFAKIFDHQFFLAMTSGSNVDDEKAGKGQKPGPTYIQVQPL